MTHMLVVCLVIAVMFFMVNIELGLDRERTRRCVGCGARHGEKHHRDCQWQK